MLYPGSYVGNGSLTFLHVSQGLRGASVVTILPSSLLTESLDLGKQHCKNYIPFAEDGGLSLGMFPEKPLKQAGH